MYLSSQMEYSTQFRDILNTMRCNSELCDGTIVSSDHKKYDIHRLVLCGASDVLKKLYTTAEEEQRSEVYIDVKSSILEKIIEAMYLNTFPSNPEEFITWNNLEQFLSAAIILDLSQLKVLCLSFLNIQLTQFPCYISKVYRHINFYPNNHEMKKAMDKMIVANFPRVNSKWEFHGDDLMRFLDDEGLNIKNEEEVIQIVQGWLVYNYNDSMKYIHKLCSCIHIDMLKCPEESLQKLVDMNSTQTKLSWKANCPRVPNYLVVMQGGWHNQNALTDTDIYDSRLNLWVSLENVPSTLKRAYHSLVSVDQLIYIIGGFDGQEYYGSVVCYDPVKQEWSTKAAMKYERCYIATCVLDKCIYAIGGFDGLTRLRTVERYDPYENLWEILPPMNEIRSDASTCTVKHKIIVGGGFSGRRVLKTVECFDTSNWQWTKLKSMHALRSGFSLISISNDIYAIGGFSGQQRLKSVEKYSLRQNRWTITTKMTYGRSNFGCVSFDDIIYIFGGFDGESTIKECESYDTDTNEWTVLPDLKFKRSAVGTCFVHGLDINTLKTHLGRSHTT